MKVLDEVRGSIAAPRRHLTRPSARQQEDIAILRTWRRPVLGRTEEMRGGHQEAPELIKERIGIRESDTGLSLPSQWDLVSDKQMMQEEQPLHARCARSSMRARRTRST